MKINQLLVNKIVAKAQASSMGLNQSEKDYPYDLRTYAARDFETLAHMLVSAHHDKYDLVSIFAAALAEVAEQSKAS